MRLDLQAPIDNLRLFKSDLEAYYWERTGDGELQERQRYQIGLWMRQVGERTAALEGIVMHMGTPTVVVTVMSPFEMETLRGAVTLLDRWIRESEPFDEVLRSVAAILNAADTLCLRAAGGRPDAVARPDASQIERSASSRRPRRGCVLARIVPNPATYALESAEPTEDRHPVSVARLNER